MDEVNNDAAIIQGSLIDVRNAGQHKEVILKIAVPAELAMRVLDVFGWPTQVNPVSVAIARLVTEAELEKGLEPYLPQAETSAAPSLPTPQTARPGKRWGELSPAQQAGIRCGEVAFWRFLNEELAYVIESADDAAEAVRDICNVKSRRDIKPNLVAGQVWADLNSSFDHWMREPSVVAHA